jgi:predicted dehydrogenase
VLRVGVIGYGYWGPNVVRNFATHQDCRVTTICDRDPAARARALIQYPAVSAITDASELVTSPEIDAVAIVTPVSAHHELARQALEHGKHIFVEKPFTATAEQAEDLIELADRKKLVIMVDHTFLFTGAVRKMKELIDQGVLGRLYYYDSTRVNLGLFQHDVNVVWDLAPHDLSIVDHLIGLEPERVVATGQAHLNGLEDIAYITLYFPNCVTAHINVNWLSPVKVRTTLVGGERKMLVWNDLEPTEKVKVYDKGVELEPNKEGIYNLLVSYRSGDMWAPRVEQTEALQLEARYFLDCVNSGQRPFNDGRAGLRVVRMLEAIQKSLKRNGEPVPVGATQPRTTDAVPEVLASPDRKSLKGGGEPVPVGATPLRTTDAVPEVLASLD